MGDVVADVADSARLAAAWAHVYENDALDGELAPSVARVAADPQRALAEISAELRAGSYEPRPLTAVSIPKPNGERRVLHVPAAEDRVVERAFAQVLSPLVDPSLSPSSFAYRPGMGVSAALRRLVALREDGLGWVVRTDFEDCFDRIDRQRLLYQLDEVLAGDAAALELIRRFLFRPVRGRYPAPGRGVPQGGALSPMLSNLFLDRFDRRLAAAGFPLVRYADDLVLAASSEEEAVAGLEEARRAADTLGMELGEDKTEVVSFQEGFAFLGEDVNARYPPSSGEPLEEPDKRTLYVGHQGAGVRVARGRLVVDRQGSELLSVPSGQLGRLVLFGSVGLTAGTRAWALSNAVDIVLLSRRGAFLGWVQGAGGHTAELRRRQYRLSDDEPFGLDLGRRLLFGKLTNLRTLLLRFLRRSTARDVAEFAEELLRYRAQLATAGTTAELMGVEGIAARRYFEGMAALLPEGCGFRGRQRRPPPDLVNAALGYGYAILLSQAVSACAAAGLDPVAGFLHADHGGRVSLALDLMEEFRPLVVDTVVVELVRRGSLGPEHVRPDAAEKGVRFTEEGRRRLTAAIEDRMLTVTAHVPTGKRVSYRRALFLQANAIARCVRSGAVVYEPMSWR